LFKEHRSNSHDQKELADNLNMINFSTEKNNLINLTMHKKDHDNYNNNYQNSSPKTKHKIMNKFNFHYENLEYKIFKDYSLEDKSKNNFENNIKILLGNLIQQKSSKESNK